MSRVEEIIAEASRALYVNGFFLQNKIGGGGYARVFEVASRQYHTIFACKIFDRQVEDEDISESFQAEVSALTLLSHPNVIQFFKFFWSDTLMYLILEYCPGGSIKDVISKSGALGPKQLAKCCNHILLGLSYCHQKGLAHGDIKPHNLLFDQHDRVKLADFGLARLIDKREKKFHFCGSLAYMAPEVLQKLPFDPISADIWSLGVTFYEMATGMLPWGGEEIDMVKAEVCSGKFMIPGTVPEGLTVAIQKMLVIDPRARPTANDLQQMDFFKKDDRKKTLMYQTRTRTLHPVAPSLGLSLLSRRPSQPSHKASGRLNQAPGGIASTFAMDCS